MYDIKDPANPRTIGFLEVEGLGTHRIWYAGGRYAYASALLDGFIDHILIVIDLADPTRPREVGRWWIPGHERRRRRDPDLDRTAMPCTTRSWWTTSPTGPGATAG